MTTRDLKTPPLSLWRIPRARYERMVKKGAFDPDDRVELLDGLLVVREPRGSRHAVLYARAGITDYWILNLLDEVLEVYRQPARASSRRYGWKYGSVRLLKRNAMVSPLAAPRARIRVADLLP